MPTFLGDDKGANPERRDGFPGTLTSPSMLNAWQFVPLLSVKNCFEMNVKCLPVIHWAEALLHFSPVPMLVIFMVGQLNVAE
jgi:hypothetical protein